MRFIADENIPFSLIKAIRRKGYSVTCLFEENLLGINDGNLLKLAKKEKRVLITFDKDFTQFKLSKHYGVIILRYNNKHYKNIVDLFLYLLDSPVKNKFENSLCEVFDNYIKVKKE